MGSDNGLSPVWCQAIIWIHAESKPIGINFKEIWIKNSNIFIKENTFENVDCKMSAIVSPAVLC